MRDNCLNFLLKQVVTIVKRQLEMDRRQVCSLEVVSYFYFFLL